MTTILVLFTIIGISLYGMLEYYKVKLGTKPQRTPVTVAAALAQMLDAPPDEENPEGGTIMNLGSGFGDFVHEAARRMPLWQIDGVEESPTPWILSNLRSFGKKYSNFRFFLGRPVEWSLRGYDVIFIHQEAKILKQWEVGLGKRLPTGALLVCLNAQLPRVKPANTITLDQRNTLYIYQKRAKQVQKPPAEAAPTAAPVAQTSQVTQPTSSPAPQPEIQTAAPAHNVILK